MRYDSSRWRSCTLFIPGLQHTGHHHPTDSETGSAILYEDLADLFLIPHRSGWGWPMASVRVTRAAHWLSKIQLCKRLGFELCVVLGCVVRPDMTQDRAHHTWHLLCWYTNGVHWKQCVLSNTTGVKLHHISPSHESLLMSEPYDPNTEGQLSSQKGDWSIKCPSLSRYRVFVSP